MTRIFILFLMFTTSLAFGQEAETNKKWILGGNFNFASQNDENDGDEDKRTSFEFQPYLGYMLNEDWTLGVRLALLNESIEIGSSETSIQLFGVGVFSRYKFVQRANWALFAEPSFTIFTGSTEDDGFLGMTQESDLSALDLGVGLGGFYQISPSWRFTVGMGALQYTSATEDNNGNETKTNFFGLNMGLSTIRVGMEMTF